VDEREALRWLVTGGGLIGMAFGVVMQRSRFCMVAAVGNFWLIRDLRQGYAFLAALTVAVAGTQFVEAGGWVAVADSAYRHGSINVGGALVGGLVFGFGAVLSGGCVARTVVLASEGQLGSLTALAVFAGGAALAQFGILAPLRIATMEWSTVQLGVDNSLASRFGLSPIMASLLVLAGGVGMLLWARMRAADLRLVGAGAAVGLLVVLGWWLTGHVVQGEFLTVRPESLTLSGPFARVAWMLATGVNPGGWFGLAFAAGALAGSFLSAMARGNFHWRKPSASVGIGRYAMGGLLMGLGAMWAGGCNIGQGITGVSTLSSESILAALAMGGGTVLGVVWLEHREQ
jgi:uncharacterized membrane protein YedE/YeeE